MIITANRKGAAGFAGFYLSVITLTICGIILGNRTVSAIGATTKLERKHIIIIDPGHGGEDGGAVSCTGKYESAFNLAISQRLNDLFHLVGVDTQMTRTEDVSIYSSGNTILQKKVSDLKERTRIVNDAGGNAILLSIHQNYFSQARYYGAQVFYGAGQGSDVLAKSMQASFISLINPSGKRMAKKGEGIYILEKTNCPSVLVECGFISNPGEERNLGNTEYQKKIAMIILTSTLDYITNA